MERKYSLFCWKQGKCKFRDIYTNFSVAYEKKISYLQFVNVCIIRWRALLHLQKSFDFDFSCKYIFFSHLKDEETIYMINVFAVSVVSTISVIW